MPTATATRPTVVTGPSADPMNEIGELTKRLKLPYLRRALADVGVRVGFPR